MSSPNDHLNHFLTTISVVGLIGNLIVAFVYWQKKDKQTSTFFILVLAFIDFTVCCLLVPMTIYMENILYETTNVFICKAYFFLLTTTVPSSTLLMTAIAFDRYFCICQVSRNIVTLPRARIIGAILLTISVCLGIIPALASTIITNKINNEFSPNSNFTYDVMNMTQTSSPQCIMDIEYKILGLDFFILKPFKYFYDFTFLGSVITITILYVLIYKEIYTRRKAKRDRKNKLLYNSYLNSGGLFLNNGGLNVENVNKTFLRRMFFCFGNKSMYTETIESSVNGKNNIVNKPIPLIKITSPNDIDQPVNNNQDELKGKHEDDVTEAHEFLSEAKSTDDQSRSNETEKLNSKLYSVYSAPGSKTTSNSNINSARDDDDDKKNSKLNYQASALRKRSLSHGKHVISTKDIRTAFMLFVVSFLFIVFYLPSIVSTYLALFQIQNVTSNLYITYLYFSNSAINPIIYCFLNPNFRSDLLKLFFKRGCLIKKN